LEIKSEKFLIPITRDATTDPGLPGENTFRDKFGIFLYMKPTSLCTC